VIKGTRIENIMSALGVEWESVELPIWTIMANKGACKTTLNLKYALYLFLDSTFSSKVEVKDWEN